MSETKSLLPFIEALRGSVIMNEILNILEKKEFLNPIAPIGLGRQVGVASPLIRAAFTFLQRIEDNFEQRKSAFVPKNTLDCVEPEFTCLHVFGNEELSCPYVGAFLAFKHDHPLFDYYSFVEALMALLLKEQIPEGEMIVDGYAVVATSQLSDDTSQLVEYKTYTGWETMTLEQLVAVSIEGTVLQTIADIFVVGEFTSPEEIVNNDELVFRDMTDIEKGLWSVLTALRESRASNHQSTTCITQASNFSIDISAHSITIVRETLVLIEKRIAHEQQPKIKHINDKISLMEDFLWGMLKTNIPAQLQNEYNAVDVRKDFKVIIYNAQ